jgi:hypothetical protein
VLEGTGGSKFILYYNQYPYIKIILCNTLRNEVKIPIVKEDVKAKANDFFITNVTVTKPPISPSRSLSRESRQEGQHIQGALTNERFVTESSELVTYRDGEVVEKKIVEK